MHPVKSVKWQSSEIAPLIILVHIFFIGKGTILSTKTTFWCDKTLLIFLLSIQAHKIKVALQRKCISASGVIGIQIWQSLLILHFLRSLSDFASNSRKA